MGGIQEGRGCLNYLSRSLNPSIPERWTRLLRERADTLDSLNLGGGEMRVGHNVGKGRLVPELIDAGSHLPVHRYQDAHLRVKKVVSRRQEERPIEAHRIQNLSTGSWQSSSLVSRMYLVIHQERTR